MIDLPGLNVRSLVGVPGRVGDVLRVGGDEHLLLLLGGVGPAVAEYH